MGRRRVRRSAGFAWHWDGESWTDTELPDDLPRDGVEIPALFKVWGRSTDDVWAVGGLGTALHWDGTAWSVVPTETREPLFTVTGDASKVVIVGGSGAGVVLQGGTDGLQDVTPEGAPLLQGVTLVDDEPLVVGLRGYAARLHGASWDAVDLGLSLPPSSSIHAAWADPEGNVWAVGGGVLSPALDAGTTCTTLEVPHWEPEPDVTVPGVCPDAAVDPEPNGTIARRWNEQLLNSIRRDIPHPPKHARNLLHVSMAIFDAWAAYEDDVAGTVLDESHTGTSDDVDVAISYAAYRVLVHRYSTAVGAAVSLDCYGKFMGVLGLDPSDEHTDGDDPIAVGNRVGAAVIDRFADDGANEAGGYADTTGWTPTNPPLVVDSVGTPRTEAPDVWQQLNLATAETQNGIVLDSSVQPYVGAQWREVEPFAIERDAATGLYGDPMGAYPSVDDPAMADWVVEVIRRTSELGIEDGVTMDIGPGAYGNNPLGTNDGRGYATNPATGQPYAPNVVPRGDFGRVLAEFWADGPNSETPPGHWMALADEVSDELAADELRPFSASEPVDRLTWDVGLHLAVGGAAHDAAITAWELKRESLSGRPIVFIRWMADRGQRSEPNAPDYSPDGLPLVPGLIERITEESSAPGGPHHHLRWYVGELAVRAWPGEPGDRKHDYTPITWMRARDWIPYQRRTFVTPAFPGFVSGHSTFSRAAAEVMAEYTGSEWFPGGLHEYVARQNNYLVFETGPSVEVRLQWAKYYDASDQAGQSRLWGGIHIWPDDYIGRINGSNVGHAVSDHVRALLGYDAD
ncbi:MAG: vanadium-dependent haloperoxidase [Myxococcales bacterium]|nr:vanadium-dependent haloperoxidase [Myxococcales bacterium]